jgi:transcriptional regulator with XRE-family HTH domain
MDIGGRASFAEQLAARRAEADLSLADVAIAAHIARGYVHHVEHGRRWPTQRVAKALDNALDAGGALLAAWEVADALPRAGAVPADPEVRERVARAGRHPRRVDSATIRALADLLAATRRLEDRIGSAAVLPGIRNNCALAAACWPMLAIQFVIGSLRWPESYISTSGGCSLKPGTPIRPEPNSTRLSRSGWINDPDLTALALSFKGHLAWMLGDPQGSSHCPAPPAKTTGYSSSSTLATRTKRPADGRWPVYPLRSIGHSGTPTNSPSAPSLDRTTRHLTCTGTAPDSPPYNGVSPGTHSETHASPIGRSWS